MKYKDALKVARLMAMEGPRVSAIVCRTEKGLLDFRPLEGYVDSNDRLPAGMRQIALVTPDGRVWRTRRLTPSATLGSVLTECLSVDKSKPKPRKKNGRKPR